MGGLIAAIEILEKNPELQTRLHHNEQLLRDGIKEMGLSVMHSESPIIPILMPNRDMAFQFCKALHEEGVYANAICFPAVSKRSPRLRLNASAAHQEGQIDYALQAIKFVARKLHLIN